MKSLFVIVNVHVHYDRYRFQENIGLAQGIREARSLAKQFNPNLSIVESQEESDALDYGEIPHIFLQSLALNKLVK